MPRKATAEIDIHCSHDELVPPGELKPHPKNPNKHPDKQVKLLAKIIESQGWRAPITVSRRSGFIVRGHCRHLAAIKIKAPVAPIDWQDYPSDEAEMADLVADNRLSELADMDKIALKDILTELDPEMFDIDLTGFDHEGLEEFMIETAEEWTGDSYGGSETYDRQAAHFLARPLKNSGTSTRCRFGDLDMYVSTDMYVKLKDRINEIRDRTDERFPEIFEQILEVGIKHHENRDS